MKIMEFMENIKQKVLRMCLEVKDLHRGSLPIVNIQRMMYFRHQLFTVLKQKEAKR